MKTHLANTRAHLGELQGLADKTDAAERSILERATARLDEVNKAIERQRPGVEGAGDSAQDRYTDLVSERGQLEIVIAKSRKALNLN